MKNLTKLLCLASLAAFLGSESSALAQTADTNAPATTASSKHKSKKSASTKAVNGVVASVDNDAKTITLKDHDKPYQITSKTKITKKGEPALLTDFVAGDKVTLRAKTDTGGALLATSIQTTVKPKKKKKAAPPAETPPAEAAPATPIVPPAPISNTLAPLPPTPPVDLHVTNSP